jgi:hypothetical protein
MEKNINNLKVYLDKKKNKYFVKVRINNKLKKVYLKNK